jgi:hypothetical protein
VCKAETSAVPVHFLRQSRSTCHASKQVAEQLTAMGYPEVRHYVGSKADWIRAGLPTVSEDKERAA